MEPLCTSELILHSLKVRVRIQWNLHAEIDTQIFATQVLFTKT